MRPSKSWTTIQCAPPYLKQFHVKKPFLIVHKVTVVEGTPYYNPSWHRGQKQDKNRPVEVSAEFNNMMAESLAHHSVKPQGRSLSLFQIVWLECLQTRLGWLDALPLCKTNTFSTLFYLWLVVLICNSIVKRGINWTWNLFMLSLVSLMCVVNM